MLASRVGQVIVLEEYAFFNLTSQTLAFIYSHPIKLITSGSTAEPDLQLQQYLVIARSAATWRSAFYLTLVPGLRLHLNNHFEEN